MKVAVAIEMNNGWNSPVAYRFARAPFFAIIDYSTPTPNLQIIQNPHAFGRGGIGPMVAQWLASMGVNLVIVPTVGPNASAALASFGIQVRIVPPGTSLRDALISQGFSAGP